MNAPKANTPVIIGVGFYQEKKDDPLESQEPYQLMLEAIADAARNAGAANIAQQFDSISVQQGMWEYPNPGKLLADELGCPKAKSILADLGVLQLTPLFDLCNAIASGEQAMGVVTGGEAKFRELRGKITGQAVSNTVQEESTAPPDVHLTSADPFASPLESEAGIFLPVQYFAIIESALRHHRGLSVEQHRDQVAQLYSGFSEIASRNPHAWNRSPVAAEDIRNPSDKNSMLAFPYTKRHNTQWNVNQGVAIIVCSVAKAEALGLDSKHWVYPLAAVQSRHVVCLSQQKTLYSHPGTVIAGQRARALAGINQQDIDTADLYSCFPAAVQSFALDLELQDQCPLSVTGSMAFAGGPYNHSALDGAARMAEVLRSGESIDGDGRRVGLVSNLSGIFGKQACALFSNQAGEQPYGFEDITEEVAAQDPPLELDGDYSGPATIVGYTVTYNKETMVQGFAYCDTPSGARTVAKTDDAQLMQQMTEQEFCGRQVQVHIEPDFGRRFSL